MMKSVLVFGWTFMMTPFALEKIPCLPGFHGVSLPRYAMTFRPKAVRQFIFMNWYETWHQNVTNPETLAQLKLKPGHPLLDLETYSKAGITVMATAPFDPAFIRETWLLARENGVRAILYSFTQCGEPQFDTCTFLARETVPLGPDGFPQPNGPFPGWFA